MDEKEFYRVMYNTISVGDDEKALELLSSHKEYLNLSAVFGTWLHIAADHGQQELVKKLLDIGMDVNKRGGISDGNPLNLAAAEGHIDIVEYLFSKGAELDVTEPTRNPLFSAIQGGHTEIAKFLIDAGIDTKVKYTGKYMQNMDALAFAREWGRSDIAEYIEAKQRAEQDAR